MTTPSLTNPNPKREDEQLRVINDHSLAGRVVERGDDYITIEVPGVEHVTRTPDAFEAAPSVPRREAKATDVIGYLNVYRDDDGDLVTGSSDLCASVEEAADFEASDFADHVGVFALVPAASARPSPGDPVRAALEKARPLVADRVAAQSGRFGDREYASILAEVDAALSVSTPIEERAAALSRATSPIPGDMAQHAYPEPSVSTPTGEGEAPGGVGPEWQHLRTICEAISPNLRDCWLPHYRHRRELIEAVAALAHSQQGGERDGWKLIDDTAPKDRYVLTAIAGRHEVTRSHWNNGIWTGWGIGDCPTHWMPLPRAPTSASKSSGEEV